MKVGVPTEIKSDEYRVAITPAGVREMVEHGDEVLIESGAGEGSAISDERYALQGATIVTDAATVFGEAEMILHVKELQASEIAMLRPDQLLFTYLHLAPDPEQTRGLTESGVTAVAYETVEDTGGRLPLLAPMSEVAGKIATQAGAYMLQKPEGGRGILLGGVPGVAGGTGVGSGGGGGQRGGDRRRRGRHERRLHRDRDGGRRLRLRPLDRPAAGPRRDLQRALLDRLLDHAGGRGDAAAAGAGGGRGAGPRGAGALRGDAGAAEADETGRGDGRRGDRPGR